MGPHVPLQDQKMESRGGKWCLKSKILSILETLYIEVRKQAALLSVSPELEESDGSQCKAALLTTEVTVSTATGILLSPLHKVSSSIG